MSFCSWSKAEYFRDHFEAGIYVCAKCGNELFNSEAKYKHATPWPAFTQTINPDSVRKTPESSTAIKLTCGQCFNNLGHEFIGDGPTPGVSRF
ncbi:methionine-R-sulfoxide reductase B1-A [Biomphalaria glabrata]|nr:methionine-R-sulfoxide reductase B1-A-like [Biomphalaria glabrata]KAI8794623.1 methionine-R-sulfoxide reductase B1-A [Biomphalaria glabrata]